MPPGAREHEQLLHGRADLGDEGLRRPAAAHRDDDDVAVVREQPGQVPDHGCLPHPLAGPDHADRRQRKRLQHGRFEPEVSARVRDPAREHAAGEPEPLPRPQHRLVGEVEHELRPELRERLVQIFHDRHAVVRAVTQLLRPADYERAHEVVRKPSQRVPHDRRIVLAVDECERPGHLVVTSSSIRVVYFSNASVSVENWMIRSWSWNGYLRQTST
jgi:hypothetical protein